MRPLISISDVTRDYALSGSFRRAVWLHALRGVSLDIARGEVVGIVGESGSGKSTLIRLLLGIETPTSGSVTIDGRPVSEYHLLERARLVQPVFRDPYSSLNPRKTVGGIIAAPLEVQGWGSGATRGARVRELMAAVGLPRHLADVFPAQLSGGQRQRVAIARALVAEPSILVCDEPTSALDVSVQSQILNLLSHIADRVAVMYFGEIVEQGPTDDVFAAPRHPDTRELLRSILLPEPNFRLPELKLTGEFPSPTAPPPGCAFHPRCLQASDQCRVEAASAHRGGERWVACHHPLQVAAE